MNGEPADKDIAIGMLLDVGGPHGEAALARLQAALDPGTVGDPDEDGFFEVHVRAPSFEAALDRVWNAVAAAGVDDDLRFAEHPDLPEHWKRRARDAD